MNILSEIPQQLLRTRARAGLTAAVISAASIAAGCGSSGSSTITVGNENKADNALVSAGRPTSTTATTPTSGPLATEPVVTPPKIPAPKTLIIKDLIVGTGPEAKVGQTVTVNYVGVLLKGGKEFDASWKRKEPFSFTLGNGSVIKGWDQGVVGMKVGGRRMLVIPSNLAYGPTGSGSSIPPNAALVFVIDLLGT